MYQKNPPQYGPLTPQVPTSPRPSHLPVQGSFKSLYCVDVDLKCNEAFDFPSCLRCYSYNTPLSEFLHTSVDYIKFWFIERLPALYMNRIKLLSYPTQVEAVAAHTQAAVVSRAGLESPFLCHLREPPSTR